MKLTNQFWTRAYQSNIGKLIGVCYRYTGNYQLSEDLVHDAFLKAIEKSQSFRGDGNFEAWLRRIIVNHALQYLRNQKKNPYPQQLTPEQAADLSMEENTSSTPPMEFTTNELLETIDQLPEHHKLVFNLYVLEKFTHAQIGYELGISEGTSKSHLARARKKLQLLLTQKLELREEKGNRERVAILLFALADDARTDQLFFDHFEQFSIPPRHPLSLQFPQQAGKELFAKILTKKSFQFIAASSVVIGATLVILFNSKRASNRDEDKLNNSAPVSTLMSKDTAVQEKNIQNASPQTATIPAESVNTGRNKKFKTMKPLDSLALLLALSSGTVNATSMKDSIKKSVLEMHATAIDSSHQQDQAITAVMPKNDTAERGTFSATELYWNKNNMEVDFKGDVRVDFREQHFRGKGKFNFLGKVYLLVVDGQRVDLGNTIKLSDQDYYLAELNSTEAISKYGDAGRNGAILIYKSK